MRQLYGTLSAEEYNNFKQCLEPMVDIYGRISFVYFAYFDKRIPILQPGGFRVESGAKAGS